MNRNHIEPIDNINWLHVDELDANSWNPNVVFTDELRLLESSILLTGWVQPILINSSNIIIDGYHRYMLSKTSRRLNRRYEGMVPCARLPIDDGAAKLLTVRMNRAKGVHVAVKMGDLVQQLIDDHNMCEEEVAAGIGADLAEVQLLYVNDIFKQRNLKDAPYSQAWEPADD